MTAIADATDSTDAETLAQVVESLRTTVEQQADRIDALETTVREQREELADHKDHTGREFADVRGRITDAEDDIDAVKQDQEATGERARENAKQDEPETETWTPLETVVSLPEDVAERELHPTQKRARFLAADLTDYGTKVRAGIRLDSRDMRRVLTAAAEPGQTIHRTQVKRVMDLLDDLGREDVKIRKKRGRAFMIVSNELVKRLADQQRNGVCNADQAVRALQAT